MNISDSHYYARRGMNVRRYHQYSVHEVDTVGKHSCGVAALVLLLAPEARKEVLDAAEPAPDEPAPTGGPASPTRCTATPTGSAANARAC